MTLFFKKNLCLGITSILALTSCQEEQGSSETLATDRPLSYKTASNSELFRDNESTPADVNQRVLSQLKNAIDLYKTAFQEVLGKNTDLKLTKVYVQEGTTETLSGELSMSAGAGSSRAGSKALASLEVTANASAVNVPYTIQFEFLLQDKGDDDTAGKIVRFPVTPIRIDAQKEVKITASGKGEVSGLAGLPGPLKKIVAFMLADINAKLSGGFSYTKSGSVYSVDLDYVSKKGKNMTPFMVKIAKDVVFPLCKEARTKAKLSLSACNITTAAVEDPVTEAEAQLARANAHPAFRKCAENPNKEQMGILRVWDLYFSAYTNNLMANDKVYLYKDDGAGTRTKFKDWGTFMGEVKAEFCPGKAATDKCFRLKVGSNDKFLVDKCASGLSATRLTYSLQDVSTLP